MQLVSIVDVADAPTQALSRVGMLLWKRPIDEILEVSPYFDIIVINVEFHLLLVNYSFPLE